MAGRAASQHIPEVEHFVETGRVALLYPVVESHPAKMPKGKTLDLHPSPAGPTSISAKRASILGRPVTLKEEMRDGFRHEELERDESGSSFGSKVIWLIDGQALQGSDGERDRRFPDEHEAEARRCAGMLIGEAPQSIVRIPASR